MEYQTELIIQCITTLWKGPSPLRIRGLKIKSPSPIWGILVVHWDADCLWGSLSLRHEQSSERHPEASKESLQVSERRCKALVLIHSTEQATVFETWLVSRWSRKKMATVLLLNTPGFICAFRKLCFASRIAWITFLMVTFFQMMEKWQPALHAPWIAALTALSLEMWLFPKDVNFQQIFFFSKKNQPNNQTTNSKAS